MIEKPRYQPFDLFEHIAYGNLYLLEPLVRYKNTQYVFDSDGIKINSAKNVLAIHNRATNLNFKQHEIDKWEYIKTQDLLYGLTTEQAEYFESLWYEARVLETSEPYLFMRPLIKMLAKHTDKNNLHVLTARKHYLKRATLNSYRRYYPQIPKENILIRYDSSVDPEGFKLSELRKLLKKGPCIFIDDSFANLKRVLLDPTFANCLCIHVPLGKIQPEFYHERLIVLKRFPLEEQGMLPLYELFKRIILNQPDIMLKSQR